MKDLLDELLNSSESEKTDSKRKRRRASKWYRKKDKIKQKELEEQMQKEIRILYVLAIIGWIILVFYFKLYETEAIGILIIILVIIVFFVNWWNARLNVETEAFGANFLALAFLLAVIINWNVVISIRKISTLLFLGVIFIILSLIDIQVQEANDNLNRHVRITLHTISIGFFALAIYHYYIDSRKILQASGGKMPMGFTGLKRDIGAAAGGPSSLVGLKEGAETAIGGVIA